MSEAETSDRVIEALLEEIERLKAPSEVPSVSEGPSDVLDGATYYRYLP
jgi:hypothetical protein